MTFAARLCLVLLATFGLTTLLLSGLVALAWRAGLSRARLKSSDLLAVRLFPVCGGLVIALTGVLPAFVLYEPVRDPEKIGPWLVVFALFALATLVHGAGRGWRACVAARGLLRSMGTLESRIAPNGQKFAVVDVAEPIVAVVGGWHPRIIAARCVVSGCGQDEFRQVVAHEAAHVTSLDNLRFLVLLACPDALAWAPLGASLKAHWRAATEFEADARAAGSDPRERVALASALLKVARLSASTRSQAAELIFPIASADVEGRIRRLLEYKATDKPQRIFLREGIAACALLMPVIAMPLYARIQELLELLVRLGR